MSELPRHRCLIYSGAPSVQLTNLAATIRDKLQENYRCLYINSPPMVAGIRSFLSAAGIDVLAEIQQERLLLSSDQSHLVDGLFDPKLMLVRLKEIHDASLHDGYVGLWASGDMAWEFGPAKDFAKLVEYERGLEEFLHAHPTMCGVCQYHADILPRDVIRDAIHVHPTISVNETLYRINPDYIQPSTAAKQSTATPEVEGVLDRLYAHSATP